LADERRWGAVVYASRAAKEGISSFSLAVFYCDHAHQPASTVWRDQLTSGEEKNMNHVKNILVAFMAPDAESLSTNRFWHVLNTLEYPAPEK
jgi:hypothetical protein